MSLRLLVGIRFQVLFHSPYRGAFHLSLTVLVLYRSLSSTQPQRVVSLFSDRIPRVPPYSRIYIFSTHTGLSPTMVNFSTLFRFLYIYPSAGPISLATTFGVSVDFLSYRYLDVSVPCVRFNTLCVQILIQITLWVPPFGYPRINAYSQLPAAFRSVSRPSSPLIAQASAKCSYLSLDSFRINNLLRYYLYALSKIYPSSIFVILKKVYILL